MDSTVFRLAQASTKLSVQLFAVNSRSPRNLGNWDISFLNEEPHSFSARIKYCAVSLFKRRGINCRPSAEIS